MNTQIEVDIALALRRASNDINRTRDGGTLRDAAAKSHFNLSDKGFSQRFRDRHEVFNAAVAQLEASPDSVHIAAAYNALRNFRNDIAALARDHVTRTERRHRGESYRHVFGVYARSLRALNGAEMKMLSLQGLGPTRDGAANVQAISAAQRLSSQWDASWQSIRGMNKSSGNRYAAVSARAGLESIDQANRQFVAANMLAGGDSQDPDCLEAAQNLIRKVNQVAIQIEGTESFPQKETLQKLLRDLQATVASHLAMPMAGPSGHPNSFVPQAGPGPGGWPPYGPGSMQPMVSGMPAIGQPTPPVQVMPQVQRQMPMAPVASSSSEALSGYPWPEAAIPLTQSMSAPSLPDWPVRLSMRHASMPPGPPTAARPLPHAVVVPEQAPSVALSESGRTPADWVIRNIDTVHQELIPTRKVQQLEINDDNTVTVSEVTVEDRDEMILATGEQVHLPELDRVLPIRDPADPSRVHPDYVSSRDPRLCSSSVEIKDVLLTREEQQDLWEDMLEANPELRRRHTTREARDQHFREFVAAIRDSIRAEIAPTLNGRAPPSAALLDVRKLEGKHCGPGEDALLGQLGLFLTRRGQQEQPCLRNGKITCVFAGGKLVEDNDTRVYESRYRPPTRNVTYDYGADVIQYGTTQLRGYVPFGGGNVAQFANTSAMPEDDGKDLMVDPSRCNSTMSRFTVVLTRKDGTLAKESLMMCTMPAPLDPPDQEIRLNYGERYRIEIKPPRPKRRIPDVVKLEPDTVGWPLSPSHQNSPPHLNEGYNAEAAVDLVTHLSASRLPAAGSWVSHAAAGPVQGFIMPTPQHTNDPRAQRYAGAYMNDLDTLTISARNQLNGLGAQVVPNSGSGLNCLIISLLQHAKRDYTRDDRYLKVEAEEIRTTLGLGQGMLYPDDPHFANVVSLINHRYGRHLDVTVAQAWENGSFMPINSNSAPGGQRVLLLQSSNHYEAVVMRTPQLAQNQTQQLQPPGTLAVAANSGFPARSAAVGSSEGAPHESNTTESRRRKRSESKKKQPRIGKSRMT